MLDQQKKIIALTGAKGVGKSSIAKSLESRDWTNRCVVSFAEPLRKMMSQLIPMSFMTDPQKKEEPIEWLGGKSPRQLLQSLGTEWGRDMVSQTIWIDSMRRLIADQPFDVVIIDDCRFANEIAMVREMGGVVIGLQRDTIAYTCEHSSEQPLDGLDHLIEASDIVVAAKAIEQLASL